MMNETDDIAFLREQIDRNNDDSFFVLLYDFCCFDKKIFKKILKICLETEIEDKNLRAEILDILHFTTYLMLCHRDKKDVYKIKNFKKVEEKFGDYFQTVRQISRKFITQ
ncbi:hypothetical protein [uncultured Campylobacter sp.]|uniref:hypothetical protein n=1 Tax=uncultured Campylobacter sp. TaxID=218934 RepID=UPI0028D0D678|nr:hypothetical protein [uncultured Campylobacter sp.]